MESFLIATGTIFIFFISAYGWGGLAARYLYANPTHSVAYDVSLGLAIWVFIGGILNALGLAYPIALDSIVVMGLLLFVISVVTLKSEKKEGLKKFLKMQGAIPGKTKLVETLAEGVPLLLIFFATAFLIITILPTNAFNHHDDLYKYLPRLFRMLQSGKLGGTPFDFVGIDTLGAHPFLQSFVAVHSPLQYLNGFDAVFCFLLSGILLNDIGRKAELPWFLRVGAIIGFMVINPQYVNISALYSGSLMILALIYASLLLNDCLENVEMKEMFWASIPFAFILTTLVALKITFVPFAASYSILFFTLLVLLTKQRKKIVSIGSISAAVTGLLLSPWLWSVYEKVVFIYQRIIIKISHGSEPQAQSVIKPSVLGDLFSAKKLFYGGHTSDYSFIVLCALAAALWAGYLLVKRKGTVNKGNLIVVITAGVSLTFAYLVNGYFARAFDVGIRYSCPIIIAIFPAIVLLFEGGSKLKQSTFISDKIRVKQFAVWVTLGVSIGFFLTGWYGRINQLTELRTMISYPINQKYVSYISKVLSDDTQESVVSMQEKTKEGTTILVWSEAAFLLDFERNNIFTVGSPGTIAQISDLTTNDLADADILSSFLKSIGVRYVMWGYKETPKAQYKGTPELQKGLEALSKKSKIVFNDGKRAILDISG